MDINLKGIQSLSGEITVPGDKSISHRALILGALSSGKNSIKGLSNSKDVLSTKNVLETLGIPITLETRDSTTVEGVGISGFEKRSEQNFILDCGNSGTTARLMIGLLAGAGIKAEIVGDESLSKRPMGRVVNPLRGIGIEIEDTNNHLPVKIMGGRPVPFNYRLEVASAQVKSALILASLFINGTSTIIEPEETRDHTERMLLMMDADIKIKHLLNGKNIIINGRKELTPLNIKIPGDISSAVFFIAAAMITPGSEITIRHVLLNPTRAHILDVFKRMGGNITVEVVEEFPEPVGDIYVKSSKLKGTTVSGYEIPLIIDEIPALAVVSMFARGKTSVRGASELRVKESDRIKSIVHMVNSFGGRIDEFDDGFVIDGKTKTKSCEVESFGDHRIAMASAVAALNTRGSTTIKDFEAVEISFPTFLEKIRALTK